MIMPEHRHHAPPSRGIFTGRRSCGAHDFDLIAGGRIDCAASRRVSFCAHKDVDLPFRRSRRRIISVVARPHKNRHFMMISCYARPLLFGIRYQRRTSVGRYAATYSLFTHAVAFCFGGIAWLSTRILASTIFRARPSAPMVASWACENT